MTILPKKKQTKEKSEASTSDHQSSSGVENRHDSRVNSRRPPSPPQRWGSPTPREDPRLGASHDPGGRFDDFGSHEGPSNHNKRRHRSSPHRNIRKHRGGWDLNATATSTSHTHRHSGYRHDTRPSTSQELNIAPNDDNLQMEAGLDELSGYNSGDEYSAPPGPENIDELEEWFCRTLAEKRGFAIKKMAEDGACMFRSVADQVYGDQEMHHSVRRHCVDYMAKNADFFRHYVTEDFETYLNRKRIDSSHGNHVEIQALSELYNRPIEVYQYSMDPINTFHGAYKTDNDPIRLSYHGGVHYNSVIDPNKASIGVGLGLPGYQPGLADKNLMHDAIRASENCVIEKTMLEDKLRETDWEVTQESIDEQVARESYIQWLRDQEKLAKTKTTSAKSASATCSSASESQAWWEGTTSSKSPDPRPSRSPRNRSNNASAQNSPNRLAEGATALDPLPSPKPAEVQTLMLPGSPMPSTTQGAMSSLEGAVGGTFPETMSMMNHIPPQMYGLSEWDEDDILAQVIAQSQQEYLDGLKKKTYTTASSSCSSSPRGGSSPKQDFESDMDVHEQPTHTSKNSHSNSKGGSAKKS